jgi:hypothetical protein
MQEILTALLNTFISINKTQITHLDSCRFKNNIKWVPSGVYTKQRQ